MLIRISMYFLDAIVSLSTSHRVITKQVSVENEMKIYAFKFSSSVKLVKLQDRSLDLFLLTQLIYWLSKGTYFGIYLKNSNTNVSSH